MDLVNPWWYKESLMAKGLMRVQIGCVVSVGMRPNRSEEGMSPFSDN